MRLSDLFDASNRTQPIFTSDTTRSHVLREEVYNSAAWVYHRTQSVDNVNAIKDGGFRAGDGDMYGRGIYATYDLESQFAKYMKRYGDYIIKAKVNLDSYLICDMDVAKRIYGRKYTILDQIKRLKIRTPVSRSNNDLEFDDLDLTSDNVEKISHDLTRDRIEWTSVAAKRLYNILKLSKSYHVKGLVYTGSNDGRCIVAYDPTTVVPYAYTHAPVPDHFKYDEDHDEALLPWEDDHEWTKIVERSRMRPTSDVELVKADPKAIMTIKHPSPAAQMSAVEADPELVSFIKRPTSVVFEYLLNHDMFQLVAHRAPFPIAKKALLFNIKYATLNLPGNEIWNDPDIQRLLVAHDNPVEDFDLNSHDPVFNRLKNADHLAEDVLDKLLDRLLGDQFGTRYELRSWGDLLRKSARTIRDPALAEKMVAVMPELLPKLASLLPTDFVLAAIRKTPRYLHEIKAPTPEMLHVAITTSPSMAPSLVDKAISDETYHWLAEHQPVWFVRTVRNATLQKIQLSPDVLAMARVVQNKTP